MTIEARNSAVIFSIILLIAVLFGVAGCAPSSSSSTAVTPEPAPQSTASPQSTDRSTTSAPQAPDQAAISTGAINVVVAGYIDHGPLQPTVRAIKEVLAKYGDKVTVTWVDLSSQQGQDYFKEHQLSAHMNVIINGTSQYKVNGRSVDFQWFEGQQWTKQDLDTVLAGLADK
jgi:hypothetical protein